MADPRNWKDFERLVAAIHAAADQGAHVQWNQKINGRQFDVVINFTKGMYKYTTAIECKKYAKAVAVDKVDAFVTKCRDSGINFGVIASSSGFQDGASTVAERHNITLLHITENSDLRLLPYGAWIDGETDALHIAKVSLRYHDDDVANLPEESHALTYYVRHIVINTDGRRWLLEEMLSQHSDQFLSSSEVTRHDIPCPADACVVAPDDGEIRLDKIKAIHVEAGMSRTKIIRGPAMFDPYLLAPDISVKNLSSGEERIFPQIGLPYGFDTNPEVGKFYENRTLSIYYYCESIDGDMITWILVESYQLGQLLQATIKQETQYAKYYVEVTDQNVIRRLRNRLNSYKNKAN